VNELIHSLADDYRRGRLDRRAFIRRALLLGLSGTKMLREEVENR
jgi:hypothetical protein